MCVLLYIERVASDFDCVTEDLDVYVNVFFRDLPFVCFQLGNVLVFYGVSIYYYFFFPLLRMSASVDKVFSVCTLPRVSQSVLCLCNFACFFVFFFLFFFCASVILFRHSEKGLTFLCVCCVEQGWLTCRVFFFFFCTTVNSINIIYMRAHTHTRIDI